MADLAPSFATPGCSAGAPARAIQREVVVLTDPGSYTLDVPVWAQGFVFSGHGAGGAGGAAGNSGSVGAGGGGGGGYGVGQFGGPLFVPGSTVVVVVGAAGAGPAGPAEDGEGGGDTTIAVDGTTRMNLTGGFGGKADGMGGLYGRLLVTPATGLAITASVNGSSGAAGGGSAGGAGGAAAAPSGGAGGAAGAVNGAGGTGAAPGGGGGGSGPSAGTHPGGDGAAALVSVEWWG